MEKEYGLSPVWMLFGSLPGSPIGKTGQTYLNVNSSMFLPSSWLFLSRGTENDCCEAGFPPGLSAAPLLWLWSHHPNAVCCWPTVENRFLQGKSSKYLLSLIPNLLRALEHVSASFGESLSSQSPKKPESEAQVLESLNQSLSLCQKLDMSLCLC